MRELTHNEIDEVSGAGFWTWVAGVAGGVVGNYVYTALGGNEGINQLANDIRTAVTSNYTPVYQA